MIESILARKQVSAKTKLTVKALIAAGIVNLPVALLLLYSLRNMLEDTEYTR